MSLNSDYDIKIDKQTNTTISFEVCKDNKLTFKTPIFSKEKILEVITEKELEQNSFIDLTLKDEEFRTVEQILNNAYKFKKCSNCGNISLKERISCWNCKSKEFEKLTDKELGKVFHKTNPFNEVRV